MTPKLRMRLRLKWIGKPDSVMTPQKEVTAIIHLAPELLLGSSDLTRGLGWTTEPSYLVLLQVGFAKRSSLLMNR